MSNRNNMIPIPGRLHSVAEGEPVSGADEVLDDALNMEQSEINQLTVGTKNASTGTTGAYPYNGMGRVVLHKNMVNGVNTLTQDMLYKGDPGSRVPNTNTIFVIQYDFTLGEDITIPANCVLEFDGGSLSNGTIAGNNTLFQNCTEDCLLVDFDGTFGNMVLDVSWIGLHPKGDGTFGGTPNQQQNFDRLNNLVNGTESIIVNFKSGNYGFGGETMEKPYYASANRLFYGKYAIVIAVNNPKGTATKSLTINGNGCKFVNTFPYHMGFWAEVNGVLSPVNNDINPQNYTYQGHTYKYGNECGGFLLAITLNKKVDFTLDNFTVDMNMENMLYGGCQASTTAQTNIEIRSTIGNVVLTRINSMNAVCDCFRIGGENEYYAENVSVKQCNFINGVRTCAAFSGGKNILIDSCMFKDAGQIFDTEGHLYKFEGPWCCIDIEPYSNYSSVYDVMIRNCEFVDSNDAGFIVSQTNNLYKISIDNCVAKATKKRRKYKNSPLIVGNAEIEDVNTSCGFLNIRAKECANVDNITLENVTLGEAGVYTIPNEERPEGFDPSDTTKEYIYSQCFPIKKASLGSLKILTTPGVFDAPYAVSAFDGGYINYKLSYTSSQWKWSALPSNNDYRSINSMKIDNVYILLNQGALLTTTIINIDANKIIHNFVLELSAPISSGQAVLSINRFLLTIDNFIVIDTNEGDAGEGILLSPGAASKFTPQNVHNFVYIKRSGAHNAVSSAVSNNVVNDKASLWYIGSNARFEESKNISRYYFNSLANDEYRCIGELPYIPAGSTLETVLGKTQFFFTPNIGNQARANSQVAFVWYGRNGTSNPFIKKYFGVHKNCPLYNVADFATLKADADVTLSGLTAGECVFDKSTNQMIIGKGSGVGDNVKAVRYDGENYTIKTHGTFAEKPTPTNIGFQYFNEDTHKMIVWDGTKWYNPDGSEAVS